MSRLPTILGCCVVFNARFGAEQYFAPQAFSEVLAASSKVPCCINHIRSLCIADSVELWTDDIGLWCRIRPRPCLVSKLLLSAMAAGHFREMSLTFDAGTRDILHGEYAKEIHTVTRLFEVSLVWKAACRKTTARLVTPYRDAIIPDAYDRLQRISYTRQTA